MIGVKVRNYRGELLAISNDRYPVIDVQGLTPAGATVNASGVGISDGTFFNSSYVNQRNIVLTLVPNNAPEEARLELYQYFKPKHKIRLYFETELRHVYIDGYVEAFEGSLFANRQSFQASIICPQPFFKDVDREDHTFYQSLISDEFEFEFAIDPPGVVFGEILEGSELNVPNLGEEETGLLVTLVANNVVRNPVIYNNTTHQFYRLNTSLIAGDMVMINSNRGQKSVTLNRQGTIYNIINDMAQGSSWLMLPQGNNMMMFSAGYGAVNLEVSYEIDLLYQGV